MKKVLVCVFSGRKNGNSDDIAEFISKYTDSNIIYFRDITASSCTNCNYECMHDECKYYSDDIYYFYSQMKNYDQIIYIVPNYCSNPSSLYFIAQERSQGYFMRNEEDFEGFLEKLYIVGLGNTTENDSFSIVLNQEFRVNKIENHVLILGAHKYNLNSIKSRLISVKEFQEAIRLFLKI